MNRLCQLLYSIACRTLSLSVKMKDGKCANMLPSFPLLVYKKWFVNMSYKAPLVFNEIQSLQTPLTVV